MYVPPYGGGRAAPTCTMPPWGVLIPTRSTQDRRDLGVSAAVWGGGTTPTYTSPPRGKPNPTRSAQDRGDRGVSGGAWWLCVTLIGGPIASGSGRPSQQGVRDCYLAPQPSVLSTRVYCWVRTYILTIYTKAGQVRRGCWLGPGPKNRALESQGDGPPMDLQMRPSHM